MSALPPIRRLLIEEFSTQKSWISPLLLIFNSFTEAVVGLFSGGITIKEHTTGDILPITLAGTLPVSVVWRKKLPPVAVIVGNTTRLDGAAVVLNVITTGLTSTNTTISGLATTSGIAVGMAISGTGIPGGSFVTAVNATTSTVTSSAATTATTTTAIPITFTGGPVGITWGMSSDGKSLQVLSIVGVTPTTAIKYRLQLVCHQG